MSATVAKDVAEAAPVASERREAKAEAPDELKTAHFTRRRYRSQLIRFQRTHRYAAKKLSKEASEEDQKARVKHAY